MYSRAVLQVLYLAFTREQQERLTLPIHILPAWAEAQRTQQSQRRGGWQCGVTQSEFLPGSGSEKSYKLYTVIFCFKINPDRVCEVTGRCWKANGNICALKKVSFVGWDLANYPIMSSLWAGICSQHKMICMCITEEIIPQCTGDPRSVCAGRGEAEGCLLLCQAGLHCLWKEGLCPCTTQIWFCQQEMIRDSCCWSLLLQALSLSLLQVFLPQTLSLWSPPCESTWNFRVKAAGAGLKAHCQKYSGILHHILSTIFLYLALSPRADFAASACSFFLVLGCDKELKVMNIFV